MRYTGIVLVIAILFASAINCVMADESVPVPATAPTAGSNLEVKVPDVIPDTQVFRRTPIVDGVVDDGEWDAYYTLSDKGWEATTYVDWDSDYLYAAVRSNKPLNFLIVLDCCNDGWFHGEDNYEFRTTRGMDGSLGLAVSRYESKNSKLPIAIPVSPQEASMVEAKCSQSAEQYVIEMRIPVKLVNALKTRDGQEIGLQLAVNADDDAGWIPNSELGDTKECTLVSKKIASLKPLEIGFDLRDSVIARGDDIVGKFHLTNSGNETIDVNSFVIAGEGKAGKYLSSEMIRLESLLPNQHIAKDYRAAVLSNMDVGSWALGAEVRSATGRIGSALISFSVVEPFEVEMRLPEKDIRADVKDVTIAVIIKNNRRTGIKGSAKVVFPAGWDIWRGIDTREFHIAALRDSAVSFKAKPPLGAIGDMPIKVEVSCNGETKSQEEIIRIVNP